jgi:hypothetical protein
VAKLSGFWSEAAVHRVFNQRMERRQHNRYDLKAFVNFFWKNRGNGHHHGEGFTRDLSGGGIFVYTETQPPVGASVQIEVFFPATKAGSGLQMAAKGRVLRVEQTGNGSQSGGFAAKSKNFLLRNRKASDEK